MLLLSGPSGVSGLTALVSDASAKNGSSDEEDDDTIIDEDIVDEIHESVLEPRSAAPSPAPSAAAISKLKDLLRFPKIPPTAKSTPFGPPIKKQLCKWAYIETAPDFAALRWEDCLHGPFKTWQKKNTDHWKLAHFVANASGAAAHTSISAAAAVEGIFAKLTEGFGIDPFWSDGLNKKKESA